MTARSEVRFPVDDGVELGAWLYLPKSDAQRCPAITMAHGHAGVKEHGITIACVVSQVPTISGYQQGLRRVAPEGVVALAALLEALHVDVPRALLES
jgi:dienelactone hydrolase